MLRHTSSALLPNVQDEPRPQPARLVLLGARDVTDVVVGSGALLAHSFIGDSASAKSFDRILSILIHQRRECCRFLFSVGHEFCLRAALNPKTGDHGRRSRPSSLLDITPRSHRRSALRSKAALRVRREKTQ